MILWLLACGNPAPETPAAPEVIAADARAGANLTGEVGTPITFDGTGSEGVSFRWFFGDGSSAEGLRTTHSYPSPGTYVAVLEATGSDGVWKTDSVQVIAHLPLAVPPPTHSATLLVREGEAFVAVPEAHHIASRGSSTSVDCTPRGVGWSNGPIAACEGERILVDEPQTRRPGQGALVRVGGHLYQSRLRSIDGMGQVTRDGEPWALLEPDPGPDSDTGIRGVVNLLGHMVASPDGGTLYIAGTLANLFRGAYRDGQPLTHETTVRAVLIAVDVATGTEKWRKAFDDAGRAGALATSPLGDTIYVAHPGTGTISIVDAHNRALVGAILEAGRGIDGLAVEDDRLYVHAWLDREVRIFEDSVLVDAWSTVDSEPLPADILLGKQLFHDSYDLRISQDGYLSCAVCHPFGDQDGLVWDFTDRGEGLRNTSSLLGRAGLGMGPLHWTGNFDEVQDFEADLRLSFGGHGFLSEADWEETSEPLGPPKAGLSVELDALAAYLTSLQTVPESPYPPVPQAQSLFDVHCASCHPAPLYTDSTLESFRRHDVGTLSAHSGSRLGAPLDGLDTPTLLGVHATGPWLHDGSAASLEDAIAAHLPITLTDDERVLLAAFVQAL